MEEYAKTYALMSDDELLRLAAESDSLVENARNALFAEIATRGLGKKKIQAWKRESADPARFSPEKTRPRGVTVLAGFYLLAALMFAGRSLGFFGEMEFSEDRIGETLFIAPLATLISYGLFKMRNWARILALVIAALNLPFILLGMVSSTPTFAVYLVLPILVIWYLARKDVSSSFHKKTVSVLQEAKLVASAHNGVAAVCPRCGATYRSGFRTCSDCKVPLRQLR